MSCYQKKTYPPLSSPSHALAPKAELSCSAPIVTEVPHMGNVCRRTLPPTWPHPSLFLLSPSLPRQHSRSVTLAKETWQFLSQVRPVTHGRTFLPQSGRRGVTERSRLTALPDLREWWGHLFEAATKKGWSDAQRNPFVHLSHFPSYARVTAPFTALQETAARDNMFPSARSGKQGYVAVVKATAELTKEPQCPKTAETRCWAGVSVQRCLLG